jgi:hypothetical protein
LKGYRRKRKRSPNNAWRRQGHVIRKSFSLRKYNKNKLTILSIAENKECIYPKYSSDEHPPACTRTAIAYFYILNNNDMMREKRLINR